MTLQTKLNYTYRIMKVRLTPYRKRRTIIYEALESTHRERDDQVQRSVPSGGLEMPGSLSNREPLSDMHIYRCVTSSDPLHAPMGHNAMGWSPPLNFFGVTTFALIYRAATLKCERREAIVV